MDEIYSSLLVTYVQGLGEEGNMPLESYKSCAWEYSEPAEFVESRFCGKENINAS
jgi:hypothetical protein